METKNFDIFKSLLRQGYSKEQIRGLNLRGSYLIGVNLRGADLYGADLYGADLYGADLYGANLYGANLHGANLSHAILPYRITQLGPTGGRRDYLVYKHGIDELDAGCFRGTLKEFKNEVEKTHGDNMHGQEYKIIIEMLEKLNELDSKKY